MLKRFIEMLRSERSLSLDVRLQLVDGLFHPFASLVTGAIAGLWIAITVSLLESDALVQGVADFIVVVAVIRIILGFRYISMGKPADETNARQWELAYGGAAALFAASLGAVTLLALLRVDNPALHMMLTTTTAGYAASITGRNAGRPWVALSQLYLAATPLALGLILSEPTFYKVMGVAFGLFLFGMTDITVSVRKTIVGALEMKRRNGELAKSFEQQANLFDDALNNMSHGLCMFDRDGRLLVWNQKLAEILECPADVFEPGMTLDDLLERLGENAALPLRNGPLVEAIENSLDDGSRHQSFVRLPGEKVVAVSQQTMENGNAVIVFEDVTEQSKANERIQQLAWTDELTGLMNRASFQELFRKSLGVLREGEELALHVIDLDHFKSVNDTLGHPVGDKLLVQAAERITETVGPHGHVARLGGDEFVVIHALRADAPEPEALAAAVMAALCEPFDISGHHINIGASVGIAVAPQHGRGGDILLKRADMALYKAKSSGRKTALVFEADLDLQAQQRRELELDIRNAIVEGQFTLAFQPIIEVATGRISCFESLIRWTHPTRGVVSPAEFIPVSEETGLVVEIGRWVLREACRTAASWKSDAAVAVNFSAVQFQDRTFPDFLAKVLDETGLPAQRLELEITETALVEDSSENHAMLDRFREMGLRISLDDFGTGYSSLSQLRNVQFGNIKIDGSFVRDLGRDASSVAVIRAVTSIGGILDMAVVAECVESEEQLQFLVSAGCTHLQGYLLGRPQPADAIPELLAGHSPKSMLRQLAA